VTQLGGRQIELTQPSGNLTQPANHSSGAGDPVSCSISSIKMCRQWECKDQNHYGTTRKVWWIHVLDGISQRLSSRWKAHAFIAILWSKVTSCTRPNLTARETRKLEIIIYFQDIFTKKSKGYRQTIKFTTAWTPAILTWSVSPRGLAMEATVIWHAEGHERLMRSRGERDSPWSSPFMFFMKNKGVHFSADCFLLPRANDTPGYVCRG
jgi:hypothetical protein